MRRTFLWIPGFAIILLALWACTMTAEPTPAPTLPPTETARPTVTVTRSPTITPTPQPTPERSYHLTYITNCKAELDCMYEIEVGCLESDMPCLGQPQMLFAVSRNEQGLSSPLGYYQWSSDGERLVLEGIGVNGQSDIFVGDWRGENWSNLTKSAGYEGHPIWSLDGQFIRFLAKGEDEGIIQVVETTFDGQKTTELFRSLKISGINGLAWSPDYVTWSPDENRVLFVHLTKAAGYQQVFIANADGSEFKQLTNQETDHFTPSFSPDGKWVVMARELDPYSNQSEIVVMRFDGTDELTIAQDVKGSKFDTAWSPNGKWISFKTILYSSTLGRDIYLIRPDGTNLIKVTNNSLPEFFPSWRVVP